MSHPGLLLRTSWVAVALVVLALLSVRPAGAQGRPDSLARRDSARAGVPADSAAKLRALADSILLEDDPDDDMSLDVPVGIRQSFSVQSLNRGYTIGGNSIAENVGVVTYRWRAADWRLSASASPLRYAGNGTVISGAPPVSGRLDWSFAKGDTLRVYGRSASVPASLDSTQSAALGLVSVSTIDLESFSLGTQAMFGARAAFTFDLGNDVSLGLRGGLEVQPKPTGRSSVYWTGTTVLAGASLGGLAGDLRWSGSVDFSRSSADSLLLPGDSVGRNLFAGGGSLSLGLQLDGPLTSAGDASGVLGLWYQRPIDNDRADQPNRLLPVGDTFGAFVSLDLPIQKLVLSPTLSISRESASDDARTRLVRYRYETSSWAMNAGAALTIPLTSRIDLTPEAGATFGGADAVFTTQLGGGGPRRPGRTSASGFSSSVRGWWAGVELSVSF